MSSLGSIIQHRSKILQNRILPISIKAFLISYCGLCSVSLWKEVYTILTPKCKCSGITQSPDYASTGKCRNWEDFEENEESEKSKEKYSELKNDCDGILSLVAMRALLCPGTDPKCSGPLGELLYTEHCQLVPTDKAYWLSQSRIWNLSFCKWITGLGSQQTAKPQKKKLEFRLSKL